MAPPRRVLRPIDVEDLLVWTYARQKADLIIEGGVGLLPGERMADGVEVQGGSCTAVIERIMRLGVMVDVIGKPSGELHPDAEIVHRICMRLDHPVNRLPLGTLLAIHGRLRTRPDAMVGEFPRPMPLRYMDGRPSVVWTDKGKRLGYCPVVYEPSATRILQARMEYSSWHQGMRLLALVLPEAGLTKWRPLPPAAPDRPWETELQARIPLTCDGSIDMVSAA